MKKHLFFLYSICIIMICGLFPYNIPFDLTHSYSENEPIQVMAASAGHTDIKHAKTLRSGTSFQTKAAPEGFHYRSEERRVGKECRSRWSPYH